jgi:hypothetical protein
MVSVELELEQTVTEAETMCHGATKANVKAGKLSHGQCNTRFNSLSLHIHAPFPSLRYHDHRSLSNNVGTRLGHRRPCISIFSSRPSHLRELRFPSQLICMRMPSRFWRRNVFCTRLRGQHLSSWTTPAGFRRVRNIVRKCLFLFVRVSRGLDRDGVQRMPRLDGVPERIQCGWR